MIQPGRTMLYVRPGHGGTAQRRTVADRVREGGQAMDIVTRRATEGGPRCGGRGRARATPATAAALGLAVCLTLGAAWLPASAQSFDCAKATHADEGAICASGSLSALDDEMSALYDDIMARALMGTRGEVRDSQRAFLDERRSCGANVGCLTALYDQRIADLRRIKEAVGQGAS